MNANADPTGKGMTLEQDYLAGTNPTNADSIFRITAESFSSGGTSATLTWDSVPTRFITISKKRKSEPRQLAGQRLGTRFALRRFHHDGRLHRHQRARAILSRPGGSPADALNRLTRLTAKSKRPRAGECCPGSVGLPPDHVTTRVRGSLHGLYLVLPPTPRNAIM